MNQLPVSVLILTKNEEQDLPGCLESVAWSDDVHVLDSHSTDHTVAIAQEGGAQVTQRVFDNYASQRNAGLHEVAYKHPWVLILDADERIPAGLRDEIARFVASPGDAVAARIRRRDFLFGRWLKHAQISPFYIRLVRPDKVHYEREVNEVLIADGPITDLKEPFDHFPFSKGLSAWFDKHNRYSTMEAEQVLKVRAGRKISLGKALFAKDFNERRFHQKQIFYKMPARPLIKWLYMVVIRGSWLDGEPGMTYARLQSMYESMIVLKTRELEAGEKS